jgi:hypothetical protein
MAPLLAKSWGSFAVLGDADGPAPEAAQRSLLWITALAVIGAILLGAAVLAWVDRWRKRTDQDRLSANDQMAHFRQLYERGEISPEEFTRIRALLGERIKQELDVPTPTLTPLDEPPPEPPREPPKP